MGPEILAPMAERLTIPYLDLTDTFIAAEKATGRLHDFEDDQHLSEVGHEAAAGALVPWVEEALTR
jgi:lysophospholipase L1-like esterase